ncbi:hypothetical protein BV20DRAFT_240558 [Pilatotrama ljubarskyi]|nr:hypothetical protein BV20DRAFT_240558 [Pilatotrama ljubarskyi]
MWLRNSLTHINPPRTNDKATFLRILFRPPLSESMLSRFDSVASISGSSQRAPSNDGDMGPVFGRKLSRSGTELLNEAYKHFSAISPTSAPRAEPSLSQIVKDLDEYRDAYADDEDWPQDEEMSPPAAQSSFQIASKDGPSSTACGANSSHPTGASVPQPLRPFPSMSQPMEQWFGNASSSLENAPPPDFSMPPPPAAESPHYLEDALMEADEDDREHTPIPLSQLIDYRDDTPAPSTPRLQDHAALRRFSTIPAPQAQPLAPHRPIRGASASNVGQDLSSPVRRSRRVQEKIDELRAKNEAVSGIYVPSPSRRRPRKS